MKLCVSDLRALSELRAYLSARTDYIVSVEEPGTLRVGVLGSHRDGGEADLERYLDAWRASHPGVKVTSGGGAPLVSLRRLTRASFPPPGGSELALVAA
jgi:hypothetical protein